MAYALGKYFIYRAKIYSFYPWQWLTCVLDSSSLIFCKIITFMEVVLTSSSIYHLLALSLERMYIIHNAVNCRKVKLSMNTICMMVLLCWMLALVPAAPLWTEFDTRTLDNTKCWQICSFPFESVSTKL